MSDYYIGSEKQTSLSPIATQVQNTQYQNPFPGDFANVPNLAQVCKPSTLSAKILKYLVEAVIVAAIAYFLGKDCLSIKNVIIIGITAAVVFAILDMMSPTISVC